MTGFVVNRSRMWGQYRRPNEPILVKLPADPDAHARYLKKGFTFIKYGADEEIPLAILDTSAEQLQKIAPKVDNKPEDKPVTKQYTCEICQKVFTHHLALAGHKSKHKKEV